MAGLLRDIGSVVLLASHKEPYHALLTDARQAGKCLCQMERAAFGAAHTEVGAYLLGLWGLPTPIVEAVLWHHNPADSTGQVFNSINAIEQHKGKEMNPFVNPGAIATTSMVKGSSGDEVWGKIIRTYSDFAGRDLKVNEEVYKSESDTNQRNKAIAELMFAYGRIKENPDQATDIYTRQCSVSVNTKDLAMMAATLANEGVNPVTGKKVIEPEQVAEILAVMATAGLYDDSGKWLFATGLPAKSGVGGGLIAVSPGKFGIAVISPPLDEAGNSVRAQKAIADISNTLHGNPYIPETPTKTTR